MSLDTLSYNYFNCQDYHMLHSVVPHEQQKRALFPPPVGEPSRQALEVEAQRGLPRSSPRRPKAGHCKVVLSTNIAEWEGSGDANERVGCVYVTIRFKSEMFSEALFCFEEKHFRPYQAARFCKMCYDLFLDLKVTTAHVPKVIDHHPRCQDPKRLSFLIKAKQLSCHSCSLCSSSCLIQPL